MKKLLTSAFLILTTFASTLQGADDLLKFSDVDRIMQHILKEHLDRKEITSKILDGAVTVYIDQFDPHRMYLLESEVEPFIHPTLEEQNQWIEQYKRQDYTVFKNLNDLFQKSIVRSRQIRNNIEKEQEKELFHIQDKPIDTATPKTFAKTTDGLKTRTLNALQNYIEAQGRRYGRDSLANRKNQVINAFENNLVEAENLYLYQNDKGQPLPANAQESLFAIHLLKALASSLDSHTSFYRPSEAFDMRVRLKKEFEGIGLILKDTPEGAMVTRLVKGGPAEKSNLIQSGDILVAINGHSVEDLPFDEVMEKLHEENIPVLDLTFKRKGKNGEEDHQYPVKLKREEIILNKGRVDVSTEPFGNGVIGKITLHAFYQGEDVSSEKDMKVAIENLERKGNLRGIILDLRDNGGGFLSQAVKVAGLFINDGVIVVSKYANGEQKIYRDVDGKALYDGPLIILTSKMTASAAEIVAQALQDYGVALVVGDERTYGKGTIQTQTVTDSQSSSFFKVTIGTYYTVSGKTPQKTGVKADIVVPSHWSGEPVGEEYLDSVEGDKISPLYNDPLTDISPDMRSWYIKYYLPKLQHKINTWRDLIPTLKTNSEQRIEKNKNYQFFLKGDKVPDSEETEEEMTGVKKNAGEDDLQMEEATNVLKDMILLHSLEVGRPNK